MQYAEKRNKKGRAMGGMVMGIRKELMKREGEINVRTERLITGRVKIGRGSWRVVGVYINEDMERKLQELEKWM